MSDPRPPKAEREELADKILHWVSTRLYKGVGPDWARIDLTVRMAGGVEDYAYATVNQDGSAQEREFPSEIQRAFRDLRDLQYEEQTGTWFSARFTMDPPDFFKYRFNFDIDPVWDPPIGPEVWAKDLALYPRSEANIPRWLHKALDPEAELPPVPPGGPVEHTTYAKHVEQQIWHTLPIGWTYTQVQFREIGSHVETNALVRDVAGRMYQWAPPQAVTERFQELRASMAGPQTTWYSAKFEMQYSGEKKLTFNRTDEPQWVASPPSETYQEELRRAGSLDALPGWLRARVTEPGS
ncbi:hypothetical protein Lesp02_16360 [Lentzea sp. NBRC 105346]|uniref:hypothetical protein n=1 Tax=Lentzea sp. NBRC 105346 TaxID=3032205 RepID=UPI0024A0847C|nr:hypothetical protein [Lentzea sp. NBRC 105346]GLZ29446.1 hypothetical protein Lesp02_16360 [Lentzea sp. NBRC 105346]